MSTSFKRFVLKQALNIAIVNALMNVGYTTFLWRGDEPLALFDGRTIATDLAATPIFIALLCTLLGTFDLRRKLSDGRVALDELHAPRAFHGIPAGVILRSIVFAAIAALLLAAPTWWALTASGLTTLPWNVAVGLKAMITVMMSMIIVPLVILSAVSDIQTIGRRAGSRLPRNVVAGQRS